MHEIHLLDNLLADLLKAAAKNKIKKISRIYLEMGKFSEINPEILKYFFKQKAPGTVAEGAQLIIKSSAARELRLLSFDGE
jgi:hydrogenase nickel incorporation protein HypA/HybF